MIVENFAGILQEALSHTDVNTVVVTTIGDLVPFPKRLLVNFVVRYVKKLVLPWHIRNNVPFRKALAQGAQHPLDEVSVGHEDIAFLQYTGGTTGVAKGAVLTHRNMVANVLQASAWPGSYLKSGEEIVITALPLYPSSRSPPTA